MTHSPSAPPPPPHRSERWPFLDSLRGVALAGVLLVNVLDITGIRSHLFRAGVDLADDSTLTALQLTVQTRFVPIFVLLFGMGLWFVLEGARGRTPRPWLPMLRRLLVLAAFGGALMLVYLGNILLEYAIVGLLVLPLVLVAPRWLILLVGVLGTLVAYAVFGGGVTATPGLMLLGFAAAAFGVPRTLERAGRGVLIVFLGSLALAVPAVLWQLTDPIDPRFSTAGGIAGGILAVVYVTGLSLLWRTRARAGIALAFEPLGRMALSNYAGAAIVVAVSAHVVDYGVLTSVLPIVIGSVGLLVVQSVVSRVWLGRFAYGPLEGIWRAATWGRADRRGRGRPSSLERAATTRGPTRSRQPSR